MMASLGLVPVIGVPRRDAGRAFPRGRDVSPASFSGRGTNNDVTPIFHLSSRQAGRRSSSYAQTVTRLGATSTSTTTRTADEEVSTEENVGDVPGMSVVMTGDDLNASGPFSVWPRQQNEPTPETSPRRLFLATVCGALVAETSGQVAERTLASETSILRLEQRRKEIKFALERVGFQMVNDRPRQIVSSVENELQRAGTISGLALLGAVGSRAIAKGRANVDKNRRSTGDDLSSGKQEKDDSSSERQPSTSAQTNTEKELFEISKTVLFSTCYTGLWQPHWFNVLNSYDFAGLVCDWSGDLIQLNSTMEGIGQALFPLAVNQLVIIPLVYWPTYFLFTGAAERVDIATSLKTLQCRLPELMSANLAFWIPVQAVQFSFIPVEDQAVYVAVMGVIWNGILASLSQPGAATQTGAATYGAAAAQEKEVKEDAQG